MAAATLTMKVDDAAMQADLALLEKAAGLSLEVRKRLRILFEDPAQLVRVHIVDSTALCAGECRIRLELAEPLAELVAAVRTGQFGGLVVESRFHG